MVSAVPSQIDRAVANLLDNAAAWTDQGQSVEVEVGGGEVVVRDHGPGIPTADLPRIPSNYLPRGTANAAEPTGEGGSETPPPN